MSDHLQGFDIEGSQKKRQHSRLWMLFIAFAQDGPNVMPDENAIEMRLKIRIAVGPEVAIIQILPVLTTALRIPTLVDVLL